MACLLCSLTWNWATPRAAAQEQESTGHEKGSVPQKPAIPAPAEDAKSAAAGGAAAKVESPTVPPEGVIPGYGNPGIGVASAAKTAPEKAPPPPAADLVPYRVQIRVGFGTDAFLTSRERQQFLDDLAEHASRWIGDAWQVRIAAEAQLSPGASFLLERLTGAEFQQRFASQLADDDKLFVVTLETQGAGYRLAVREWDNATQQLGPMQSREVFIRDSLAASALQLIRGVYRPVVKIEKVGDAPVSLRAVGGDIRPPDPSWLPLRTGAVFEGYTRVLDKKKAVQRIQQVPWSYITVGEIERGVAACSVISAMGKPFFGQKRRSEQIGLEIRRHYAETELMLRTRGNNPRPQTGLDVEVHRVVDSKDEVVFRSMSNRLGIVKIPVDLQAENPRVTLVIRSSLVPLAKLPYIPGIHPTDQLLLPDDSLRLKVEGELTLLQADIVDTVARREVIRATARAQKKTNNLQRVDQLLAELNSLPQADHFIGQLTSLRVSSTAQAKARRDRVAETRINKLCAETNDLIAKHLDAEKFRTTHDEVSDIRTVIADEVKIKKAMEDAIKEGGTNPRRKSAGT